MNINGFSPHQLVFGQNVKLPNVFNDQISAGTPKTKTVREDILVLYAARKAFRNAETSDKLCSAPPPPTSTHTNKYKKKTILNEYGIL